MKIQIYLIVLLISSIIPSISLGGIDFSLGENLRILSDKGYRYTGKDKFIAEGNVILISGENTLYGNRAEIFLGEKKFFIEEEVKLVNPEFSLLGEAFSFFQNAETLELVKAVILTDNYKIVGEHVFRKGKGDINLKNASYTTCKDCPNSWSFKGDKISITPGEYVRIKGAYFDVNGVNVFYLPYFFFPIKNERESGLLLPKLSFNLNDGAFIQLPYFQTLGEHADVTISPTVWGTWGLGGEIEFRKAFSNRNQIFLKSKFVNESNNTTVHLSEGEFSFWSNDEKLKLFLMADETNDFDSLRRFERFSDQDASRIDYGMELRTGYTGDYGEISVIVSDRANLLQEDIKGRDLDYVQVLPEMKIDFISNKIFGTNGSPSLYHNLNLNFTQFRQGKKNQNNFSRNADRLLASSDIFINYGNFLFGGTLKSHHNLRYANYDLIYNDGRNDFQKMEIFHLLQWQLRLKKDFGEASVENQIIPEVVENVEFVQNNATHLNSMEKFQFKVPKEIKSKITHRLNLNLNYYHLGNISYHAEDERVLDQFIVNDYNPNSPGLFDYRDAFFTFENNIQANSTLTSLQRTNTVELSIDQNFFMKTPKLNDLDLWDGLTFIKKYVGGISLSQGMLVMNKYVNDTKLSRLLVQSDIIIDGWKFNLSESYFHDTKEHILTLATNKNFGFLNFSSELLYDSRTVPYNKILNSQMGLFINPQLKFIYGFSYDINVKELNFENYLARYLPVNDCWFIELNYYTDKIQSRYAINFMLNLNEGQFKKNARL